MSSLLEQAIIDATALKEVALKNAETHILEKYSREVKNTLNTLLEQDEEEDPLAMGGDEGGDELGGDLGGDLGAELGGEEEASEEEVMNQIPDAHTDGEKLCPCPDEDEEIEIDFNDLARQLQDPEESEPEDVVDRDEEFGLEDEEEEGIGALMEEEGEKEFDWEAPYEEGEEPEPDEEILEQIEKMLAAALMEEVTFDGEVQSNGYAGANQAESDEAAMLDAAKALANADEKDTKDIPDDATVGELVSGEKASDETTLILQKEKEHLAERLQKTEADSKKKIAKLNKQNKVLNNRISRLQEQVQKVNLVNAKLLYTNRALRNASLNERQKIKIVESISKADSVEEAKTIFETLQSTVSSASERRAPNSLSEAVSRGRASTLFANRRKENTTKPQPELDRWRILAGLDKK